MAAHYRMTLPEKILAFGADYEAHMRHWVDELLRRRDRALFDEIRPELSGHVELDVNLQCLCDVDVSIRVHRCVVQLAVGGVAGTCIVPGA